MTGINIVLAGLFVCLSILAVSLVSKANRWKALVVISALFYYVLIGTKISIILIMAGVTYTFSNIVRERKHALPIAVCLLLVPMILFKGTNGGHHFANYRIQSLDNMDSHMWYAVFQILGLSYFTFNSISYLVDIKRNYIAPQKNFFLLLLYLIYFPSVFSGPLHRAKYLFGQFENIEITNDSITKGLRLILWALFKNTVIAQRLFALLTLLQKSEISGPYYILVGFLFFAYLYCNFSSFMDFFQGISQIFNIRLKDNFGNRVYLSASRQQFWKGWHITLNEWFRDYFFFVISKYDKSRKYSYLFLFITFLLIALWHEISIVLLIWGCLNGLWVVIEKKVSFRIRGNSSFRKPLGVVYHLTIASLLALIFISPDLGFLYQKIFVEAAQLPQGFMDNYLMKASILILCIGIMDIHYYLAKNKRIDEYIGMKPRWVRWFIYMKLAMLILVFGLSGGIENYYIQF